ncbi:hypothetical protein ABPG75_007975 [Micractinium tetrahymenae]
MRQLLYFGACLAAVGLPAALAPIVGLPETWNAFRRYSAAFLTFPQRHTLRVPQAGAAPEDFAALDAGLVAWHADASALYARCSSMAVVGLMPGGDETVAFTFGRAAGAEKRSLKSEFYAPRDLSIACYLLLSVLAYSSRSVPLALLVLCLNFANLSVCMRLKELTDALSVAADQLADAQQAFLLLPLETSPEGLLQQTHLLSKLTALSAFWSSATFCYSITVPGIGSLSVSVSVMASLAAATSARCLHRIVKGLPPELRALLTGQRGQHPGQHHAHAGGHSKAE